MIKILGYAIKYINKFIDVNIFKSLYLLKIFLDSNLHIIFNPPYGERLREENIEAFSMMFDDDMTLKMGWGMTVVSVSIE